ncbi:LysM peptidoglycan-binding domain-containing protein [Candidatus Dojkabacteria bacterium]|nr:LysM peptidoglycan-binding domain-containing protein [Candidatus Dojkabacteria bacterium]
MSLLQKVPKIRTDLVFFIIGFLIFPIVVILAIYSIFSVKDDIDRSILSFPIDSINIINEQDDVARQSPIGTSSEPDQSETTQTENESSPRTSSISTVRTGHSEAGLRRSQENSAAISQTGFWNPTQYQYGDIVENTYVVQQGDTLWQIAQAYYSNGEDWHKILESNKDLIGFLPSGEQALIYPNQILVLP